MNFTRRCLFVGLFALIIMLPLFATGGREVSSETADGPKIINIAVSALPAMLEPGAVINVSMYRVSFNIFDTLIKNDFQSDRGLMPALAESWSYIDSQTLELNLRKGVKLHDGSDFKAKDVAATFSDERLMGEGPAVQVTSAQGYWKSFDRVEIIDDYTVRIHTSAPDGVMAQKLTMPCFQIISSTAYENAESFESWAQNPSGTGPYKIDKWVPEEYLKLTANPDYWAGKPEADELIFHAVPENSARISGLVAGDYDIIEGVSPDNFSIIENSKGCVVSGSPIENMRLVLFNLKKPYMDIYLRQAMSLAVDRELIVTGLWSDMTDIPKGFQSASHGEMYIADHPVPKYDLEAAKELVKKSVYNGEEIPFFILNNYYTNEIDTCQLLVEMWQKIGVNVKLTVMENFTQVNEAGEDGARTYGMRNTSSTALYPDPVSYIWRINQPTGTVGKHNGWATLAAGAGEFNELGPKLESESDIKVRREIMERMLDIYDQDPPGIILHNNAIFYGARESLNFVPQHQYYMDFGPQFFSTGK